MLLEVQQLSFLKSTTVICQWGTATSPARSLGSFSLLRLSLLFFPLVHLLKIYPFHLPSFLLLHYTLNTVIVSDEETRAKKRTRQITLPSGFILGHFRIWNFRMCAFRSVSSLSYRYAFLSWVMSHQSSHIPAPYLKWASAVPYPYARIIQSAPVTSSYLCLCQRALLCERYAESHCPVAGCRCQENDTQRFPPPLISRSWCVNTPTPSLLEWDNSGACVCLISLSFLWI